LPAGTRGWLGLYFASSSRRFASAALSSSTSARSAASRRRLAAILAAKAFSAASRCRFSAGNTSAGSVPGFSQRAASWRIHRCAS
jgi:hypothetical protein